MEEGKIKFSDLVDFSGAGEFDRVIQLIEKLDAAHSKTSRNLREGFDAANKSVKLFAGSLQQTLDASNATLRQNQTSIERVAQATQSLVNARGQLIQSEKTLASTTETLVKQNSAAHDEFFKAFRVVSDLQKEIDALTKKNQELGNQLGGTREQHDRMSRALMENKQNLALLNVEMGTAKSTMQNLAKIVIATPGSYNQIAEILKKLRAEYKTLSDEQRNNMQIGGEMLNHIKALEAEMSKLNKQMGASGYASIRTEIRQVTAALAEMRLAGKDNTEEYARLIRHIAELKKQMAAVQAEISNQAKGKEQLAGMSEAAAGLTGAFNALKGATTLFGKENKELQETLLKLQAVTLILNGLTAMNNMMLSTSATNTALLALRRKYLTLVTLANTKSVTANIVAQKALNAVMRMSPAGWLLLTIGGLVLAYQKLSAWSKRGYEDTKKQIEASKNRTEADSAYIGMVESFSVIETKKQEAKIANLKAEKAASKDILAAEKELNAMRIAVSDKIAKRIAEDVKNKNDLAKEISASYIALDDLKGQITSKTRNGGVMIEYANGTKKVFEESEKGVKSLEEHIAQLDKRLQNVNALRTEQIRLNQQTFELEQREAELKKKWVGDELKARAELEVLRSRHDYAREATALKELAKVKRNIALREAELTETQEKLIYETYVKEIEEIERNYQIERLNREKDYLEMALLYAEENTRTELDLKIKALNKEYKAKAIAAKDNAAELMRLKAEEERETAEMRNAFAHRNAENAINLELDSLNTRLEIVTAGSAEEYELKRQLVEKEREAEIIGITYTVKNLKEREDLIRAAYARELAMKKSLERDKAATELRHATQMAHGEIQKQIKANEELLLSDEMTATQRQKIQKEQERLALDGIALQKAENEKLYADGLINVREYELARTQIEQAEADARMDIARREIEEKQALQQELLGTVQNVVQSVSTMFNDASAERVAKLEAQMEHEKEMYADNKEAQKAVERKYGQEIAKEKRKQAAISKNLAIFEAVINSSQAFTKTLAAIPGPPGAILAGLQLALGLAQVAVIQAKRIPEFWKGSRNTPQGPAWLFERGGEAIEYKGNTYYGDTPALVDMPSGAKVYPHWHPKTREIESLLQIDATKNFYADGARTIREKKETHELERYALDEKALHRSLANAVSGIPVFNTVFDEYGVHSYLSNVSECREAQFRRTNTGGNG